MEWKYRGKDKETDQWIYGDLIKTEWNSYIRPENRALIFPIYRHIDLAEVIPESVGLWTGKLNIYVGDKITFIPSDGSTKVRQDAVVIFSEAMSCFMADSNVWFIPLSKCLEKKVVGNTTDTPELMEAKNADND